MKNTIIRAVSNVSAVAQAVVGPLLRTGTHILMYHRASPTWPGAPVPTLNVCPTQLESQWTGLRERGYEIVPLQQLVDEAHGAVPAKSRRVAITFDDGYENMYTQVYPIAQRLRVPITIFVPTEWVGNDHAMHFDEWGVQQQGRVPEESYRPLSWQQCEALHASPWVEIAAHTHSHADFRGDLQRFRSDMQQCLLTLKQKLGITSPNFAFPFGRVDEGFASPEMMATVAELGVQSALTTEPGPIRPGASPMGWGRNNVFAWDTAATIDSRLAGWYGWLPRWRRRIRQWMGIAKHPLYYDGGSTTGELRDAASAPSSTPSNGPTGDRPCAPPGVQLEQPEDTTLEEVETV